MRPTAKIVMLARANKDGRHPICLRATYLRKQKFYPLHKYTLPDHFDKEAGRVTKAHPEAKITNEILRTYEQRASNALYQFEREAIRFTFAEFERIVFADRSTSANIIWRWLLKIEAQMLEDGRHGNSTFQKSTASVIKAFAPNDTLRDIDASWLQKFERWMRKDRGLNDGGISLQLRTLRASCNRAKKEKLMGKDWLPFEDYTFSHLKQAKSKRAIALEDIWKMRDADVYNQAERFALDLFMFSFYTRGMNLADIAELKPENVRELRVVYERQKTGKLYSIKLAAPAAAILDRYKGSAYLFPIYTEGIHVTVVQKFERKKKIERAMNKKLRVIAERVGIPSEDLTFYVARHSYATAHKLRGTSIEVIRELMGHSDYKTSEHYLSDFGDSALDGADEGLF